MASPDELMRAVEELRATLNGMGRKGVSVIADLARLKVLVAKYPDHARAFLHGPGDSAADGRRPTMS